MIWLKPSFGFFWALCWVLSLLFPLQAFSLTTEERTSLQTLLNGYKARYEVLMIKSEELESSLKEASLALAESRTSYEKALALIEELRTLLTEAESKAKQSRENFKALEDSTQNLKSSLKTLENERNFWLTTTFVAVAAVILVEAGRFLLSHP